MAKKEKKYIRPERPDMWVSLVTGNKYPYSEYANHGHGGMKYGKKDLPNEYPYTIEFVPNRFT